MLPPHLYTGIGKHRFYNMKQPDNIAVEGVSPMAFRGPIGSHAEDRTTPLVLPPKTSLGAFRRFMQRLEGIVGIENATIVSSDAELKHEDYMDPSKAHDVGGPRHAVVASLIDGRCTMFYPSNTSSAPQW